MTFNNCAQDVSIHKSYQALLDAAAQVQHIINHLTASPSAADYLDPKLDLLREAQLDRCCEDLACLQAQESLSSTSYILCLDLQHLGTNPGARDTTSL